MICLFRAALGFIASCELSLVEKSGSYSLVVVRGAPHSSGFSCCGAGPGVRGLGSVAPGLWSAASIVLAHELSCSMAYGIFLDQGSNLCLLHWQAYSLPLSQRFRIGSLKR